ncbi:MAG TPA: type II secretion system minor pseudopilin GspJ [Gammaproteobacteria bacterium]
MNRRAHGFTLLELLVAMAVFALVSLMAYGGLRTVLQSKQATERQASRIQQLQSAVLMLERDLGQFVARGIRDEYGDAQPALRSADYGTVLLEFTRAGWRNPTATARSTLQRVGYGIEENSLLRFSWTVLDRAQESAPYRATLLDGVREMRLRYLDAAREWHEQWPPAAYSADDPWPVPLALEVVLALEDMGEIRRLLPLPQPLAAGSATAEPAAAAGEGEGNR